MLMVLVAVLGTLLAYFLGSEAVTRVQLHPPVIAGLPIPTVTHFVSIGIFAAGAMVSGWWAFTAWLAVGSLLVKKTSRVGLLLNGAVRKLAPKAIRGLLVSATSATLVLSVMPAQAQAPESPGDSSPHSISLKLSSTTLVGNSGMGNEATPSRSRNGSDSPEISLKLTSPSGTTAQGEPAEMTDHPTSSPSRTAGPTDSPNETTPGGGHSSEASETASPKSAIESPQPESSKASDDSTTGRVVAQSEHKERPEDAFFAQATTDTGSTQPVQSDTAEHAGNHATGSHSTKPVHQPELDSTASAHTSSNSESDRKQAVSNFSRDHLEVPGGTDSSETAEDDTTPAGPNARSVQVKPGDSLWQIAQESLPIDSTRAEIANLWHQIYALNKDAIGPDPNLIHTGTTLELPAASLDA